MSTRVALRFYTTADCHLCEEAERILQAALPHDTVQLEEVEIADEEHLMARYGTRIPVIVNQTDGAELAWPFGPADVVAFLDSTHSPERPMELP